MKRQLLWIGIVQAVLITALVGGALAQEGTPTTDSTQVATDQGTPVATPVVHKHRRRKADSTPVVTPSVTVSPTVSSTPGAETKADYQFNALVVTGTKTKLKILDAPAQVEVIDQAQIKNKDIGYLDDALSTVSGVEVSRVSEGGQSVTVIQRGIPGYDNNLVLVDGFVLNQPFNDRVFWNRIPTSLVDHIEDAEGPFSSLYGRSAVGGVINIITKEPVGERFDFAENWDSTGQRTTDIDYQKRLDKNFAFFLGVENTQVNGYTSNQYVQVAADKTVNASATTVIGGYTQTNTTTGSTIYNVGLGAPSVLENDNISGKFYWNPDENNVVSLLLNVSYWDQPTSASDEGYLGTSYLLNAANPSQANITSGNYILGNTGKTITLYTADFLTGPGTNSFAGGYLQWKSHLDTNTDFQANVAYTNGPHLTTPSNTSNNGPGITSGVIGGLSAISPFGGGVTNSTNPLFGNQEQYVDFQLQWKWDNHSFVAGLSGDNANTSSQVAYWPNWTDLANYTTLTNENTGMDDLLLGAYIQDQWKFLPNLTATLGARIDYWDPNSIQIWSSTQGQDVSYNENNYATFNPKASLVWKFDPNGSLRASIGTAFNPPTPQDLTSTTGQGNGGTQAVTVSVPNPNLQPAQDLGTEVGGEYQFPTGTTVSATFFDNYFSNLVFQTNFADAVTALQTDTEYFNAANADIQGFDAELRQKFFSNLSIYGNTTVINAKFVGNSTINVGGVPTNISGNQVPYTSPVIFNAGADWTIDRWSLSGWVTHHDAEFETYNNSDTFHGVQGSFDSFTTVNLKFGYHVGDLTLTGGVNNLFNVQYYQYFQNPGTVFNFGGRLFLL